MLTLDVDGDGDTDVVTGLDAHGWGLSWFEQIRVHKQIDFLEHRIMDSRPEDNLYGVHFSQLHAMCLADIDGDGHLEIVATAWGDHGRLALFKHRGDPRGPWDKQILKEEWPRANQVIVADLTGNGRLDIIAGAERGSNEVRWWLNEGPV